MTQIRPQCEMCYFWRQNKDRDGVLHRRGECRRRSPLPGKDPKGYDKHKFPITYDNDWCGEHQVEPPEAELRKELNVE